MAPPRTLAHSFDILEPAVVVHQALTQIDSGVAPAITTTVAPGRKLSRQSPPVVEQLDVSGVVAEVAPSACPLERTVVVSDVVIETDGVDVPSRFVAASGGTGAQFGDEILFVVALVEADVLRVGVEGYFC